MTPGRVPDLMALGRKRLNCCSTNTQTCLTYLWLVGNGRMVVIVVIIL